MTHVTPIFKGLLLGEQCCWTNLYERSFLLPFWTRRKRREIDVQHESDNLLETNLPFALNQPAEVLKPGPGSRSEWFIFQLQILIDGCGTYAFQRALASWQKLAEESPSLKLTISQLAALTNLRSGKVPPVSGYDNPHYFDDTACFRALATACFYTEDLEAALEVTRQDAGITNAEDGLWGAQAVTAALVTAARGADVDTCVGVAVQHLPEGSWIHTVMTQALGHAHESRGVFDLIARLNDVVATDAYNYGNAAAETVPLALAILKGTRGELETALLAALAVPRAAGSLAPIVGALCGALGRPLADALLDTPLRGVALPSLAGTSLAEKLRDLEATSA